MREISPVSSVIRVADIIWESRLLAPIIVPRGAWRQPPSRHMKGDIDDGCMRAIAFARFAKRIGDE